MSRRTLLIWISRFIYAVCAAAIAAPMAWFLGASQRRPKEAQLTQRVARLTELRPGEPRLLSVTGTRQNAWTRYTDEVVGRVWVVRETGDDIPAERTRLKVFNVTCPHSGCPVAVAAEKKGFICNCHGARFHPDGSKVPDSDDYTNASPRGLDPLTYELVKDEATGQHWVVVTFEEFELGIPERIERS